MAKEKKLGLGIIATILSATFLTTNVSASEIFGELEQSSNDLNVIKPGALPDYVVTNEYKNKQNAENSQYTVNQPPMSQAMGLPTIPENIKKNARQKTAFESALEKSQGLTPDMVRAAKLNLLEKQKAMDEDLDANFKAENRTIPISLGVNKQNEIIRTRMSYSTAISVVDNTGKPWSVVNVGGGNAGAFSIARLDGPEGNLFSITALSKKARSNLVLVLKEGVSGIKVPVVLDLISGQEQADKNIVLRIQAVGPNGSVEEARLTEGVDGKYNEWLDGIVPKNVKKLKSSDKMLKAWKEPDGSIVVITKYEVYSPDPIFRLSSTDGETKMYKLRTKSSILLVKDYNTNEEGKVSLSGF